MRKLFFILSIVTCLNLIQCGYTTSSLYRDDEFKKIALPIFDNTTRRRGHEFLLTQILHKAIVSKTPYQITDEDNADVILKGTIVYYETPGLVEGLDDSLIQSQVIVTVAVSLIDKRNGKIIFNDKRLSTSAEFTGARGESEATARQEVFEKLSKMIITKLEKEWDI